MERAKESMKRFSIHLPTGSADGLLRAVDDLSIINLAPGLNVR